MAAKTELDCVFPEGCSRQPLLDDQRSLEIKCDKLRLATMEIDRKELEKIRDSLLDEIEKLRKERDSLQPCARCPFI